MRECLAGGGSERGQADSPAVDYRLAAGGPCGVVERLIAAEAGAIVTDAQGIPWTFASRSFVAAAPGLHAKAIETLADVTVDSYEAAG